MVGAHIVDCEGEMVKKQFWRARFMGNDLGIVTLLTTELPYYYASRLVVPVASPAMTVTFDLRRNKMEAIDSQINLMTYGTSLVKVSLRPSDNGDEALARLTRAENECNMPVPAAQAYAFASSLARKSSRQIWGALCGLSRASYKALNKLELGGDSQVKNEMARLERRCLNDLLAPFHPYEVLETMKYYESESRALIEPILGGYFAKFRGDEAGAEKRKNETLIASLTTKN